MLCKRSKTDPFNTSTTQTISVPRYKVYLKSVPLLPLPWHNSGLSNSSPGASCFLFPQQPSNQPVSKPSVALTVLSSMAQGSPSPKLGPSLPFHCHFKSLLYCNRLWCQQCLFNFQNTLSTFWTSRLQVLELLLPLCLPHGSQTASSLSFTALLNCHHHRQTSPHASEQHHKWYLIALSQ